MTSYAFTPPATSSVAIAGSDARFPIRRIFCVGRNYVEHAIEMGSKNPAEEPPFFFTKPADAIVESGASVPYPPSSTNVHHEAELVIAIGKGGKDIPVAEALDHVFGYAAGNDLTRRDLQNDAKATRRPWDMSKGFDNSAIVGAIHPSNGANLTEARITATVDGETKQDSNIDRMIWDIPNTVAYLSGLVTLAAGDLIMTGTPAGVGPIEKGQTCTIAIEGLGEATVTLT